MERYKKCKNSKCHLDCVHLECSLVKKKLLSASDTSGYAVQPTASPKCQSDCINALKGDDSEECRTCIRNVILEDNYKSDCHSA